MSGDERTRSKRSEPTHTRVESSGDNAVVVGGNIDHSTVVTGNVGTLINYNPPLNLTEQPSTPSALIPSTLHQLPTEITYFTGRKRQLNALRRSLTQADGHVAIFVLTGMGGVGKTTLAVHVAHQLVDRYPDAQVVVDMQGPSQTLTPVQAMTRVIHAFRPELPAEADISQASRLYREVLAGKRALILLDNAADAAQVRSLVPPATCSLIITSRRRIKLEGSPLLDLSTFSESDARHMLNEFIDKGRATKGELDRIAKLCGHLPLALYVAGTFLDVHSDWTAVEYIKELTDERRRLLRLKQDDLDVAAVLALSVKQLELENPNSAELWRILTIFPSSFDRAAAAAVWNIEMEEGRDRLSELFEHSLVLYDHHTIRYRMHDLVRLVAIAQLDDALRETARERHAKYYDGVFTHGCRLYSLGEDSRRAAASLFMLEWRNIESGQLWLAARAEHNRPFTFGSEYLNVGLHLLSLDQLPQDYNDWSRAFSHVFSSPRSPRSRWKTDSHVFHLEKPLVGIRQEPERVGLEIGASRTAYAIRARHASYYLSVLDQANHLYLDGGDALMRGLALFDSNWSNIESGQAWASSNIETSEVAATLCSSYAMAGSFILLLRWHPRSYIGWLETALNAARLLGNRAQEVAHLSNMGLAYANLGEQTRTISVLEQAIIICREVGDILAESNALANLGLAYANLGEFRRAIELYERAMVIGREIGDRRGEGDVLGNLGVVYSNLGDPRRAIEYHEQALVISREIGDRPGELADLGNLGNAYAALGELSRAIDFHTDCLLIAREIGDRRSQGNALGNLANCYLALNEPSRAMTIYEQQLILVSEVGDRQGEGGVIGNLGLVYANLGDLRRAVECHQQALVIDREINDAPNESIDLLNLSLALDQLGEREQAILHAEAALKIFDQIESPYAERVRDQLTEWREQA